MEKYEVKDRLFYILNEYPTVKIVVIQYYEMGCNTDCYSEITAYDKSGKSVNLRTEFFSYIESLIQHVIGYDGIVFHGEGCEGQIIIDLHTMMLSIDNDVKYCSGSHEIKAGFIVNH